MTRFAIRPARTGILTVLAAVLTLVLTACAGLPVSGPVKIGRSVTEADEAPDVSFNPDEPTPGMTPQQVVEGFIDAGTGPRNDWGIARMFLTADNGWRPNTGVTVYAPGQRSVVETAEGEVEVTITSEAAVDDTGAYAAGGGTPVLTYRLERVGGEWRISEAPDGIVLDRNRFASVFRSYSLMFFDRTWTYLVPDQRWFPIEYARVRIAEALSVGGPTSWLAGSVENAFTVGTGLSARSVPVRSQVAEVPLLPAARDLDQLTLDRMQTQLEASLGTAGVRQVDMLVDGQVLDASAVAVHTQRVEPRALVLSDGKLGFLSGAEIDPLPGLARGMSDVEPTALEVDADRQTAAMQDSSGGVWRVRDDGTRQALDTRTALVDPTLDAAGYVYSVPADQPSALQAYAPDGTMHEIADAWPGATRVYAMRVSRDGTRIAALVRDGVQPSVWVAGIVRGENGVPVGLGERRPLGDLPGVGIDLTWLDGSTLAALTEADGQRYVIEQPVGGPAASTAAPAEAVSIAGGNESGEVRVLNSEGRLFSQRGATWTPVAADVAVLAVQRGMPG